MTMRQPEALRLADIVEQFEGWTAYKAAAELRRLHERDMRADAQIKELLQAIEDMERCSEMLSQRIVEMEEQMAAIGAGGVEPLRKQAADHFRDATKMMIPERAARQAVQVEVVELKERIARAGVEQRRAVLEEREACAKACEGMEANRDWVPGSLWGNIRGEMAAAIRARQ